MQKLGRGGEVSLAGVSPYFSPRGDELRIAGEFPIVVAWNDPFRAALATGMPFPRTTGAFRAGVRRAGRAPATDPAPNRAGCQRQIKNSQKRQRRCPHFRDGPAALGRRCVRPASECARCCRPPAGTASGPDGCR